MYTYWFVGGGVDNAAGAVQSRASAWSVPGTKAQPVDLPALKLGSFDTLVKLTEDLAKADGQLEGFCRRIERSLGEADKECEIRPGETQVRVSGQAEAKGSGTPVEVEGWYYNVGVHNGKPLYKADHGAWLYFHTDSSWYLDKEKDAGTGAKNKTSIFSGASLTGTMSAGSSYSGRISINDKEPVPQEPPIQLPLKGDEREFKIQKSDKNWVDLDEYVQKFVWDTAKFPTNKSVAQTLSFIQQQANANDDNFKQLLTTYNEEKGRKATLNTRDTGSHATRDLVDVLTPDKLVGGDEVATENDDFIFTNSITTVVVCVHEKAVKEFKDFYEGVPEEKVIPRSAKKLGVDNDKDGYQLWRVLCFKDSVEKFKKACRDNKYTVRDYQYSKANYAQTLSERENANAGFILAHRRLIFGGVGAFSDLLASWVHLKVLRLVVEGALRCGITAETQKPKMSACILAPQPNGATKARADLAGVLGAKGDRAAADGEDAEEYFPYVSVTLAPLSTSK